MFSKFTKATTSMSATKALREKEAAAARAIAEDLTGHSRATAFLRISTVNVQTYVKQQFARDLERAPHIEERPQGLGGKLDDETRARLERMRRGE